MRILNISAQKPDATGSGVYLTHTVAAQLAAGHGVAVVCGVSGTDPAHPDPALAAVPPEAMVFPVLFDTAELPFHVCGMSDVMPYPATRYRDMTPQMVGEYRRAFLAALDEAVAVFQPDAIICHHLYLLCSIVRERFPELPVVAVCHSTDLRQLMQHDLDNDRICRALRHLDGVLALHDRQAEHIVEVTGIAPSKILIAGAGYDKELFNLGPVAEEALETLPGAADGDPSTGPSDRVPGSILFVGKVCRAKGAQSLLRAVESMVEKGHGPASVRLVGGWGTSEEERLAIGDQAVAASVPVTIPGRISGVPLADEYRAAEVFCLPSFFEGLPLVVVEALACGCKVVTTDLPGVRPWIEAHIPDAPIWWVAPPAMEDVDKPVEGELPAFEESLAAALSEALATPAAPASMDSVGWDAVAATMVSAIEGAQATRAATPTAAPSPALQAATL